MIRFGLRLSYFTRDSSVRAATFSRLFFLELQASIFSLFLLEGAALWSSIARLQSRSCAEAAELFCWCPYPRCASVYTPLFSCSPSSMEISEFTVVLCTCGSLDRILMFPSSPNSIPPPLLSPRSSKFGCSALPSGNGESRPSGLEGMVTQCQRGIGVCVRSCSPGLSGVSGPRFRRFEALKEAISSLALVRASF